MIWKMYFLRLFITVLSLITLAGCRTEFIEWRDNSLLRWNDFKGKINQSSLHSAESFVRLQIFYSNDFPISKVDVVCYFNTKKSWHSSNTRALLKHEQGHFNIGEIYARMLRKRLLQPDIRMTLSKKKGDSLFFKYGEMMNQDQNLYDLETSHSKDSVAQQKWDISIEHRLDSLKNYRKN